LPLSPLQRFNLLNLKKEYHMNKYKSTIFSSFFSQNTKGALLLTISL